VKQDANDILRADGADALREAFDASTREARTAANGAQRRSPAKVKTVAEFCAEYSPLTYAIEPTVRSRSLYTLTARTGAGKTAFMVASALAVATGRNDILGSDVEHGRVAYLAHENPDDVRMRLMIAAYLLNVSLTDIGARLVILDVREKPEEVCTRLRALSHFERFSLILADTLAAWFDGRDINNNVQSGEFIRRVRPLTALQGNPTVVVAAHPTKGAGEEQLVPYGGGAILNEVDGNLTLWRKPETSSVHLHWQGKLRGLEFTPRPFRFEIVGSPDILDIKGREVQLPVIRPITQVDDEAREEVEVNVQIALLRAMITEPDHTQREWAATIGKSKTLVGQKLLKLKTEKLVEVTLNKWSVTERGRKAVQ
jgi:hypothetical protein